MLKIHHGAWVEESGSRVILLRVPRADITFTLWNWRVNVGVYLHDGTPAPRRWKTELGEYELIVSQTDFEAQRNSHIEAVTS